MTSITIRNVPDEIRNELAARAALSGRSLQEYMLAEVERIAARPAPDELFMRIRERKRATGTRVSTEAILGALDADRRY
jgi:antitoxin FitA